MPDSRQSAFLDRVRHALGKPAGATENTGGNLFPQRPTAEQKRVLAAYQNQTPKQSEALLEKLIKNGADSNITVVVLENHAAAGEAIAELANAKTPEWSTQKWIVAWQHDRIMDLDLEGRLAAQPVSVCYAPTTSAEEPDISEEKRREFVEIAAKAFIGVTTADYCLADTATLVLGTRPGQARAVSLLPSIHVAVIHQSQIIADLKTLYALLRWVSADVQKGLTNCLTLINGPSKTADIEATLVAGAHGPREVYLYVVTG